MMPQPISSACTALGRAATIPLWAVTVPQKERFSDKASFYTLHTLFAIAEIPDHITEYQSTHKHCQSIVTNLPDANVINPGRRNVNEDQYAPQGRCLGLFLVAKEMTIPDRGLKCMLNRKQWLRMKWKRNVSFVNPILWIIGYSPVINHFCRWLHF